MAKVAIILFPGSNCETEALRACKRSNLQAEIVRWNDDYSKLNKFDAYIIPGGFSYEDRGRSGVIASKDPIMEQIKEETLKKRKPLLGICNGAQILVEAGFIPGIQLDKLDMALAPNERIQNGKILGVGYFNDWVYLKNSAKPGRSVFNNFSQKQILHVPIAHGEGRFVTKNPKILEALIKNNQALFQYCDKNGKIIENFPVNPNGAMYNLAGVCNIEGNVLALMPHPERTSLGQPVFDSLAQFLEKKVRPSAIRRSEENSLSLSKTQQDTVKLTKTTRKPDITILVRLIITDNEERTLENTVKNIGFPDVQLTRQIFFGFYLKSRKDLKKIAENLIRSGEILNLNKEIPTVFIQGKAYAFNKEKGLVENETPFPKQTSFIVTEHNNYSGKNLQSILKHHLQENFLAKVVRGVFWTIGNAKNQPSKTKKHSPELSLEKILGTYVFHNPHSMDIEAF